MDSDQQMTEYERQRLENIKRNGEMLASLNINSRISDLSSVSFSKRKRVEEKSYKQNSNKKKEPNETPVVLRRSLRTKGIAPDSKGLPKDFNDRKPTKLKTSRLTYSSVSHPVVKVNGPVTMKDAYDGEGSYRAIVEKLTNLMKKSRLDDDKNLVGERMTRSRANGISGSHIKVERVKLEESVDVKPLKLESESMASPANGISSSTIKVERMKLEKPIDLRTLKLESEYIARVVPGRIFSVRFFPTTDVTMVVVGNISGHIGFWDVKPQNQDEDEVIHLYQPHTAPVSGISIHSNSLSKMYTSSYDGFVRLMNVEREKFELAYSSSSGSALFSIAQQSNDANNIYFGEGQGELNMIDVRNGEITNSWSLHEGRINSIDFNLANPNIMATSSTDGLVCLWDLRKVDTKRPECSALQSINHGRAVHSAYFSPSGSSLASTSLDDNVGLLCGANFEDKMMIPHENWTNRWVSPFRASWGWDDTYLFVGNMKRRVDVLSVNQRKTVYTLESPLMTAIPCRYDAHPCTVGMLAGATSGGQVYIWTASL